MRWLLFAGAFGVVSSPAAALACTQYVGITQVAPQEGQRLPANGQMVFGVTPSADLVERVVLHGPAGPRDLTPEPMGAQYFAVDLTGASEGDRIEVELRNYGEPRAFVVGPIGPRDDTPPSAPGALAVTEERLEYSMCFGPGLVIEGGYVAGADDFGLAGHRLAQIEDDAERIVGVLFDWDVTTTERAIGLIVEGIDETPDADRCYRLDAIDRAGNVSSPTWFGDCAFVPPPRDGGFVDAGSPPDAGFPPDAATPDAGPNDAGVTPDAGTLGGPLDSAGTRCGCQSTPDRGSPLALLFAALALGGRWLSRRARS
ncbi:MAG: hypothetical protein RMA76_33055 [Deltaproteobacteria bacterium]|jgi:hypothetical protein